MTTNSRYDLDALSGGARSAFTPFSSAPLRAPTGDDDQDPAPSGPSSVKPDGSTQDDEVSFISGITATGAVSGRSGATWDSSAGPNKDGIDANGNGYYATGASGSFKWNGNNSSTDFSSMAGTTGGTLSYYFDPSANWTASEKTALTSGLDMWHQVANISFTETKDENAANVSFQRNSNNDAYFQASDYNQAAIGSKNLFHPGTGSVLTIDTASGSYGAFNDFNDGGYGVQVVLHEQGHMLGLDHGGPYNGDKTPDQQFTPYDNRAYTIMSYFNPDDDKQYPSPIATNYSGQNATTWMPLDIDAIQRLYGAQTNGQLNQAQTFGYNTTISGSLKPYFDFSSIKTPVVTLYGTAASGNRLDLSGSSAASNVNMNSGTYSSTHGLTNNITIYKNTYVQSAVTGSGDDTIKVNLLKSNQIDGGGGSNTAVFAGNASEYSYTVDSQTGVTTVTRTQSADTSVRPNGVVDTLKNIQTLQFSDKTVNVCYVTGTQILTTRGEVAVEALQVGDLAVTASGAHRPIRWIGNQTLDCRGHTKLGAILPIRIARGALGENRPTRDLWVSPRHAICLDLLGEVLVPADALINGATITQESVETVTYWHIELDSHDLLIAEGVAAESYLDLGNRGFFAGAGVGPDEEVPGGPTTRARSCRPFVEGDSPIVAFARERLRTRAVALGWTAQPDPVAGLHAVADGRVIAPNVNGTTVSFRLPAGCGDVWLVSRTTVPALVEGSDDRRRLGVNLRGLTIENGGAPRCTVRLDDARLGVGFHPVQGKAEAPYRWTRGKALVPAGLWAGCAGLVTLRLELGGERLLRWREPGEMVGVVEPAQRRRA